MNRRSEIQFLLKKALQPRLQRFHSNEVAPWFCPDVEVAFFRASSSGATGSQGVTTYPENKFH